MKRLLSALLAATCLTQAAYADSLPVVGPIVYKSTFSLSNVAGNLTVDIASGAITNSMLVSPSITVNGTTCTLGSACSPTAAGAITSLTGPVTATGPGASATTITNSGVSAGSYTNTSLTVGADGRITAASSGAAAQRLAIGWPAGIDPSLNIIGTIDQASTVQSIVGTVATAVGAAATVSVYKAASGTACGSGTVLQSGSFNANGTAVTNQTLTLTTTALSAGDRLCLVTTGGTNWTGGTGVGGLTVRLTTP